MAPRTRAEALSRERIVEAAVELLDAAGERGLTFRTLTERLATGPGAIYWHVPNKGALLDAATASVIVAALRVVAEGSPQDEIRAIGLGLFEAIERHPWLSPQLALQLSRSPRGSVTPRIFETIGQRVSALGAPETTWFTATSALVLYIFGAAGQNAANARVLGPGWTVPNSSTPRRTCGKNSIRANSPSSGQSPPRPAITTTGYSSSSGSI